MKSFTLNACALVVLVASGIFLLACVSYVWYENAAAKVFLAFCGPVVLVGMIMAILSPAFRLRLARVFVDLVNPFNWFS